MQALLWVVFCFYSSYSNAETQLTSPNHTTVHDDSYVEVPLEFVFPFYDENFTTSYMFTNGVVGFQDPSKGGVQSHWCCNGLDLKAMAEAGVDISQYSFVIAPLWTDLIDLQLDTNGDGVVDSGMFTDGNKSQMTYMWRNLAEFYDATKLNTFQLQIKDDGTYIIDYTAIDIAQHSITIGTAGDLTGAHQLSDFSNIEGVQNYYYNSGYTGVLGSWGNQTTILCSANPLYDPSCPGYAQAYADYLFQQQCSANPLYDTGCTGYQQAYYNQQCTIDPLYDTGCTGYADAYFDQQCTIDPLYDTGCTGYDIAYLDQQCSYNPLYDISCTGYEIAYFNQQCELDSQYDTTCSNYISNEIFDDGTTFDPIANAISVPDIEFTIPEIVIEINIPVVEPVFETEIDTTQGDMQSMEDSIEIEIAALEQEELNEEIVEDVQEEEIEEEIEITEDGSEEESDVSEETNETSPDNTDGDVGKGEANQDDDIEKEIAELKTETSEKTKKKQKKTSSKNDKIKILIAKKAIELTKKVEDAVTIEQQMLIQRQLLALISFVPGFDYDKKPLLDLANFYPDKPTVDHAYSRWFLNDPNFGIMEDSQYNFK